jgi:hypothetical protein
LVGLEGVVNGLLSAVEILYGAFLGGADLGSMGFLLGLRGFWGGLFLLWGFRSEM